MPVDRSQRQTRTHDLALEEQMMHTTLSRSAHADQFEGEVRDAHSCEDLDRCANCQAKVDEVRAARLDALIYSVTSVRPRRAVL